MANNINSLSVKGRPLRVERAKDRGEERREEEYERRTNKVREELSAQKSYLKELYNALVALGLTIPSPPA